AAPFCVTVKPGEFAPHSAPQAAAVNLRKLKYPRPRRCPSRFRVWNAVWRNASGKPGPSTGWREAHVRAPRPLPIGDRLESRFKEDPGGSTRVPPQRPESRIGGNAVRRT